MKERYSSKSGEKKHEKIMVKDLAVSEIELTKIYNGDIANKIEEYFNTLKEKGWEIGDYEVVHDQINGGLRMFRIHFEVTLPKIVNIDDFGRY